MVVTLKRSCNALRRSSLQGFFTCRRRCIRSRARFSGMNSGSEHFSRMDPLNPTEADFETAMTAIDEELRRRDSRVVAREMLAYAEYCHRYNVTIANNHPVAKRIFGWCKRL